MIQWRDRGSTQSVQVRQSLHSLNRHIPISQSRKRQPRPMVEYVRAAEMLAPATRPQKTIAQCARAISAGVKVDIFYMVMASTLPRNYLCACIGVIRSNSNATDVCVNSQHSQKPAVQPLTLPGIMLTKATYCGGCTHAVNAVNADNAGIATEQPATGQPAYSNQQPACSCTIVRLMKVWNVHRGLQTDGVMCT